MREILFKAKTRKKEKGEFNNVWVQGDLICSNGKRYIHPKNNSVNVINELGKVIIMHEVIPETICQYTGLTDKNGNKIWENDIVKATVRQNSLCQPSTYSDFYQVVYHEKYCYFYLKKKYNNLIFDGNWSYYLKDIKVIGNIFDNPELIGE